MTLSDYTGYDYRRDFWQRSDRRYEDLLERETLARLLTRYMPELASLMDLGCGFGRLTPVYAQRAAHIVLFDYAQNLLDQAKETWGSQSHFRFVQGDARVQAGIEDLSLDVVMSIRTLHHLPDYGRVFAQVFRVLRPGGVFIFEIPNKRHVINMLRFALGRQQNPFTAEPLQLGDAFFNYHPCEVLAALESAGFVVAEKVSISFFRSALLKRFVSPAVLVKMDRVLQHLLGWAWLTPSVYCVARKP
jgi:2-polyprenyl-6-hydroxyphenyl methylase/3-demethylubiquinone-9 3-methyltransferase